MEINIKNNLPLDILFLIRIKANEFKNEGVHDINSYDIKDFFKVNGKVIQESSGAEEAYQIFVNEKSIEIICEPGSVNVEFIENNDNIKDNAAKETLCV